MSDPAAWSPSSPYFATLGLRTLHAQAGAATVELPLSEAVANRKGNVHGGAIASLIDMAMSEAIRSSLSDYKGLATISLNVNFLTVGAGNLLATGTMTRCGGTTAFASVEVRGKDARLVATGQGAFRVIR